jgi:hypothetical protein
VLSLVLLLLATGVTPAQEPTTVEEPRQVDRWGDLISIFSGDIHIPANVRQRGMVLCIWGDVVIDGEVTQDVVVILGKLELNGEVERQVTGVLSELELRDARVSGALVSVLSDLELERSKVSRELISILGKIDGDDLTRAAGQVINIGFGQWAPSLWAILFWLRLFHKFILFVLVTALALLLPERIRLMGDDAAVRYVPAFFVGLLTYVVLLVLLAPLALTVVGFFVALFLFWVVKWIGIAAIFHAVGQRLGRGAGFSPSVLGSVLLVFGLFVVLSLTPMALGLVGLPISAVLGFVFFLLVSMPGLGLVVLTRMGGRRWSDGIGVPPPAAPPAPQNPSVDTES